jgi:23S rRNA pseudouridine1911/1915/1917 synthase
MRNRSFTVNAAEKDIPLIAFLAQRLALSRKKAKQLLDQRLVFVNRKRVWMARHLLRPQDEVEISSGTEETAAAPPTAVILRRDPDFVVVNKPAGMLSNGPDSLETRLRAELGTSSLEAVHRLDRDTSGCILYATHPAARNKLVDLFKRREVSKTYRAIVAGRVERRAMEIRSPLDGQPALTRLTVLKSTPLASHVQLQIETGRTHQIRRHLASIGHPVLGDRMYFTNEHSNALLRSVPRQMLHAAAIAFPHPSTGGRVFVQAPIPSDYHSIQHRLGLGG